MMISKITGFGFIKEKLIITSSEIGFLVFGKENKYYSSGYITSYKLTGVVGTFYNNINKQSSKLIVNDFIIHKNTMYVIVANFGLKILSITHVEGSNLTNENIADIKELYKYQNYFLFLNSYVYNPSFEKLDFFFNYFTQSSFVEISINNNGNNSRESGDSLGIKDFFVELLINNEYSPVINKVFYSTENMFSKAKILADKYFSFFFNIKGNKFYVIKKGLLNSLSHQEYILPLSQNLFTSISKSDNGNGHPIQIVDKNINQLGIVIISGDKYQILSEFRLIDDKLICKFLKEGNYTFIFNKESEFCSNSLGKGYSKCLLSYVNNIIVVVKVSPYLETLKIILIVLVVIILLYILISLLSFVKCFRTCYNKEIIQTNVPILIMISNNPTKVIIPSENLKTENHSEVNGMEMSLSARIHHQ